MSGQRKDRRRAGLVLGSFLAAGAGTACASDGGACSATIAVGMTKSQVRAKLGAPERIGRLEGKDIERVAPEAEDKASGRLVYFYPNGARIWFENEKVTGTTCSPEAGSSGRPEDH